MIELKSCSFKGVEFLYSSMPTPGGNRVVTYNYPGSDKQTVEVQGRVPRNFVIEAIIPHDDYFRKRDLLITALEDGEAGILQHPTFGEVNNVISGKFELDESINSLGRAKITINFYVNDASGIPVRSKNLISEVKADSDFLNNQIAADIDSIFNVTPSNSGNFQDAFTQLTEISGAFTTASDSANKIAEKSSSFRSQINAFNRNIRTFIQSPLNTSSNLSSNIIQTFDSIATLFNTPRDTYSAYARLFYFGDLDTEIHLNTFSRLERAKNRGVLRASMKTLALSYAYVEAASVEYNLTDELESTQRQLENQYIDIRENTEITNESLEALDRLRVRAIDTLDDAAVQTRNVITINTPRRPLSVLLYAYYGNTDLMDIVSDLNNIKRNSQVEGDIKILSL